MSDALTTLTIKDRVATLRLNNPPYNVMTLKLRIGMMQQLLEIEANHDVSVLIIEGAGEKAFSAGFDLKDFPGDEPGGLQMIRFAHHVLNMIFNLPQITIVKMRGHVLGGGACLMLACDLRVATIDAKIGMPEIKFGAFSAGGGTHMLARQIGLARAKELVLLGDSISGAEAKEIGLINRAVSADKLDGTVDELAERLAKLSRPALRVAKKSVNAAIMGPFELGQTIEAAGMAQLFRTSDVFEGVNAFNEKRPAKFVS
jgi:enoyl-CoA hydratase/carnithine racemase